MPLDQVGFVIPAETPDVFSLDGLIAWLEKQPADGAYDFWDYKNCALCQYLHAQGLVAEDGAVGEPQENYRRMATAQSGDVHRVAVGGNRKSDWTFGEMLSRARAVRDSRP